MTDKAQKVSPSKPAVYLLLNGSEEKQGQTNPTILRFKNRAHLNKWLAEGGEKVLKGWQQVEGDNYGGWPSVIEVSYRTAENADQWLVVNDFYAEDCEEESTEDCK